MASRALLEEDWIALEKLFEGVWRTVELDGGHRLNWALMRAQPRAFQRRALNRLVEAETGSCLALAGMEAVLESLRIGKGFKTNIMSSRWIVGDEVEGIRVVGESVLCVWGELSLPENCALLLPDGAALKAEKIQVDKELFNSIRSGAFSHNSVVFVECDEKHSRSVRVRLWRPGDAYQAMGRGSSVKIKELFSDRKIPIEKRKTITCRSGQ